MMMEFIDQLRAEGYAVESIIRVLPPQGMQVAARTYRSWRQGRVAARTLTDAMVVDAVLDAAWTTVTTPDGAVRRTMTPEGLYGRRKMSGFIRRTAPSRRVLGCGGPGDAAARPGSRHAGRRRCAPRSPARTGTGPGTC